MSHVRLSFVVIIQYVKKINLQAIPRKATKYKKGEKNLIRNPLGRLKPLHYKALFCSLYTCTFDLQAINIATTMEKKTVGTLCLIRRIKVIPSSLMQCSFKPCCQMPCLINQTLIDGCWVEHGKNQVCFSNNAIYPILDVSGKRGYICNKLRQVFQLFFP